VVTNIAPLPISLADQSLAQGDPLSTGEPSLMRLATIRHNLPTTIGSLEIGEIVTILHGRPPTTKRAKITEIVTILHNPKPPGSATVRMRIIIILRGVAKGLRMRIIIILRVKMRIILTRKNSTKTLIRSPLDPKYNRGRTLNTLATGP